MASDKNLSLTQTRIQQVVGSNYTLIFVLLTAFALRTWHVVSLRSLPLFDKLMVDSDVYDRWAQYISAGNWLGGDTTFYMDPLYPYVLALLYKIFGHDLLVVRLVQAAVGTATCALVAIIGYRVSNQKSVGTVAAFLLALYGPVIFQEGEIEKTAFGLFFISAALTFTLFRTRLSCFLAGGCIALATLTRGNVVLLIPLAALYFFAAPEKLTVNTHAHGTSSGWFFSRLAGIQGRNVIAFILGCSLILAPTLLRNHYVSGEWVIITSMTGQNLYTGNNPYNNVGAYRPLPFVRPQSLNEAADFHAKAESVLGRKLTDSEVSSFWFREATTHITDNPLYAAAVFARKFCLFWSNVEIADAWDYYFMKRYSPALNLPLLQFGILAALAALGAVTTYRDSEGVRLLIGFVVAYCCSVIAFFILARYRIHVVPALTVLASLGLHWLWKHLRERHWLNAMPHMVLSTLVLVFSYAGASTFGYTPREHVNSYTLLAELYRMKGDFRSAEALLNEARVTFNNDPSTLLALGLLYGSKKELDTALYFFNQCVQKDATFPDAWFLLGATQENLGKIPAAITSYKKQLEYIPNHEASANRLSALHK